MPCLLFFKSLSYLSVFELSESTELEDDVEPEDDEEEVDEEEAVEGQGEPSRLG